MSAFSSPRMMLDYGGMTDAERVFFHAKASIVVHLQRRAKTHADELGPEGAVRLDRLADTLMNEIGVDKKGMPVDPRTQADDLEGFVDGQLDLAEAAVARRAEDSTNPQGFDGLQAFKERLQAFRRSFLFEMPCDCDACDPKAPRAGEKGYSFVADELTAVPKCLRLVARDIEIARTIVEEMYGHFLRPVQVIAQVDFTRPTFDVVNGETMRCPKQKLRRIGTDPVARGVNVRFSLPVEYTDETAASLLYVAVHELGIHAVQQWHLREAPAGEMQYKTFSEGLVEAAVSSALIHTLMFDKSKLVRMDAYKDPVVNRRDMHINLTTAQGNSHDPKDVKQGHDLFYRLTRFAEAAIANPDQAPRIIEQPSHSDRDVRCLFAIRSGTDWARRFVIALNLADLTEDEREDTIWWLNHKLVVEYHDFSRRFHQYKDTPLDDFKVFFNLLNAISLNAFNQRKIDQLKKTVAAHSPA